VAKNTSKINIILLLLLLTVFAIGSAYAQVGKKGPVAKKIQKLVATYQEKQAQGYDLSEVRKTLRLIKAAREKGDRPRVIQLLRKIEIQLEQAKPPAASQDTKTPSAAQDTKAAAKPSRKNGSVVAKGPWPTYGHDRRHTCRSPYKGLTEQPVKPKWTFTSPGGHGISSPTAIGDDGKLYVGTWKNRQFKRSKMKGHSGTLCSLFPDGTLDWMHDSERGSLLASGVESSPLLLSDGKIIFGKDDGHVYALNLKGEVIWDFSCDDPFDPDNPYDDNEQVIPSPVLGPNGIVYVCSHWANVYNPKVMGELSRRIPMIKRFNIKPVKKPQWSKIYAIDPRTGSREWVYDLSLGSSYSKRITPASPAVGDDGTIYFGTHDNSYRGYLYALNPDGTLKWIFPKSDQEQIYTLSSTPSIADDGTIYIGSFSGKNKTSLYAINPDGTLKWYYEILENRITAIPAIGPDGTIYVGSHNWGFISNPRMSKESHMYAIRDLGDRPSLKWKFKVKYGIVAPSAIDVKGNIFFGTHSDPMISGKLGAFRLYALNNKGEKLWSYPLNGKVYSPPVIDRDGTIYVGTTETDAKLYAFGKQ